MKGVVLTVFRLMLVAFLSIAGSHEGFASTGEAKAEPLLPVVMDDATYFDSQRQRPIKVVFWYPAGRCVAELELRCNHEVSAPLPPVLLSHGAMGSALEYQWLARTLAARGHIVVGVSHFGESWVYGQESIQPEMVTSVWHRPQDISAVLNNLRAQPVFNKAPNWSRVIAAGHSSGGYTALALAGLRLSAEQLRDYCDSDASDKDLGCRYAREINPSVNNTELTTTAKLLAGTYADARVIAAIVLAPALGPGATQESLANIKVPVFMAAAQQDDFLPHHAHGQRYAKGIQKADVMLLNNGEGHFVFVDPCEHSYRAQGVAICQDAKGVDRQQAHHEITQRVLAFVDGLY